MERCQQTCPACAGAGECPDCGQPGLPCDLCSGSNRCARCAGTGRVVAAIDIHGPTLAPRGWRRANLHSVTLCPAPDLGEVSATFDDLERARRTLRPVEELESRIVRWCSDPLDAPPSTGARCVGWAHALCATSGSPLFLWWRADPASPDPARADWLLETRVLEANLLRSTHFSSRPGAAVMVEIHAAYALSDLHSRLSSCPEDDPASPIDHHLIAGAPSARAAAGNLAVVLQTAQEMFHWAALERDREEGWRLLLQWEQIGWHERGTLGSRRLARTDIERFGLDRDWGGGKRR